jgi:hypothetical protein
MSLFLFAVLALALAFQLGGCSPGRTLEAVAVLRDIEAGHGASSLKETTRPPVRTPIAFTVDGRLWEADLYTPAAARAGLVLVPGLTPRGRDDERVIAFANTLARARFEVIVPDLPGMRALQVSADEARPIADAARYLDERGAGRPLGMAAVSFAVGPAILALEQPAAAGRVNFFLGIGGYYDLDALLTYITTGFYREDEGGRWRYRPPKAYGKWIFLLTNAGRLAEPVDREILYEIADRKLDNPHAEVEDLLPALGPDGRAVYALITNADPERVPALLAALPPEVRSEIEALDLKRRDLKRRDLSTGQINFVLIHDRDDRIIPAAQSEWMARAVGAGRAQVHLVEGLDHAEVKGLGISDAWSLLDAISAVLRYRDAPKKAPI